MAITNPAAFRIRIRSEADPKSNVRERIYLALPGERVPKAVRWSLILFVFAIPFESAQTVSGSSSWTRLLGLVFGLSYFFYYNPLRRTKTLPGIPAAMWWFLGYFAVYVVHGFFVPHEYLRPLISRFITLSQLILLFWIGCSIAQNYEVSKSILLGFVIASAVLAIATFLRLPGFYGFYESGEATVGRVTAMDVNPNAIGELMAESAVALIGLHISGNLRFGKAMLLLALPLLTLLVETGSRAAIGGFVIGCSVYLFLIWRSKRKLWTVCLAALGLVALIYIVSADPLTLQRVQASYYQGDVSGRDTIFSAATEMIEDRPIFGWHPIELWFELGLRVGEWERDAHNLFLHLLLEVGLLGTLPFLIGLGLCVRAAWKASAGKLGLVFLALLLTLLVNNLAGTGLATKSFWLLLALAVGAGTGVTIQQRQSSAVRALRASKEGSSRKQGLSA